ncbi:hypothetical protein ABPG77_010290 [Micractinium sp. CCAP 211/92]
MADVAQELPSCDGDVLTKCCPLAIQYDKSGQLTTACEPSILRRSPVALTMHTATPTCSPQIQTFHLVEYPPPTYSNGTVPRMAKILALLLLALVARATASERKLMQNCGPTQVKCNGYCCRGGCFCAPNGRFSCTARNPSYVNIGSGGSCP